MIRFAPDDYLPRLPEDRSVGIGCVGAGFIMRDCHLVAYNAAPLNVVGIHSRTRETAEEVAQARNIPAVHSTLAELLSDPTVQVLDVAVPPDVQAEVILEAVDRRPDLLGILAQKPLGCSLAEAERIVSACESAGITLAVNQNMRYDQSVRQAAALLRRGELGTPVFASLDMRAVPHWMPWQERLGWVTLRIMSIHHLDAYRFWFGDPLRITAHTRPDPRTAERFEHTDGICLWTLEYESGLLVQGVDDVYAGPDAGSGAAQEIGIGYRIEGTEGLALGTIGWPDYPARTPSTLRATRAGMNGEWVRSEWPEVWFPDAFLGPMAELLCAIESESEPNLSGRDNLRTMALVDAAYASARTHRAVPLG